MAGQSGESGDLVAGRWHLVAADCPEDQIPDHRVDFVFHNEPAGLRGVVLSRVDGREIPLHTVAFNGAELRLRMAVRPSQTTADPPFLVMTPVGDRFEGAWDGPGIPHIRLKLIRAPQ